LTVQNSVSDTHTHRPCHTHASSHVLPINIHSLSYFFVYNKCSDAGHGQRSTFPPSVCDVSRGESILIWWVSYPDNAVDPSPVTALGKAISGRFVAFAGASLPAITALYSFVEMNLEPHNLTPTTLGK